eukprot:NODE_620_length_1441_cov_731.416306.p1 GENE.NODE_620_length_1441_cov_731.416306~~NODE_620_length_1441_cov_731.416306.p1  ORF type:complete len:410 (-),score=114.71 NODE_620_length_1441_cov_731.416306:124-1353(-)
MAQPEYIDCVAMACEDATCDWKPWEFKRRAPGDYDVELDVHYCGVCHSDLHATADHFVDLGLKLTFPAVAGHEIAGVVVKVGSKVTRFQVGSRIGVGPMIDSCRTCKHCKEGDEQECVKSASFAGIQTYGDPDKCGRAAVWPKGSTTKGGFSNKMVVHEDFGIRVPENYPMECVGPVMCSGITMYNPLVKLGAKPGSKVAYCGLGGLGGMGIQLAKEMGCIVTAVSRGPAKKAVAIEGFGAHFYLDSKSDAEMAEAKGKFDLVFDTIPVYHDINPYRALVAKGGKLHLIGITPTYLAKASMPCTTSGVSVSKIGGIRNTEEVLRICDKAEPKILPKVVIKPVTELNNIYTILDSGNDTGERFVLDIKGTLSMNAVCDAPKPTIHPAVGNSPKFVCYEWFKLMGCMCCQK